METNRDISVGDSTLTPGRASLRVAGTIIDLETDEVPVVIARLAEWLARQGRFQVQPDRAAATSTRQQTRADRIVEIVAASGDKPMSRADIIAALHQQGDDASEQVVTNALHHLIGPRDGRLVRGQGGYVAKPSQR